MEVTAEDRTGGNSRCPFQFSWTSSKLPLHPQPLPPSFHGEASLDKSFVLEPFYMTACLSPS